MKPLWFAVGLVLLASAAEAQSQRLPLPVEPVAGALTFETTPPVAGVLSGLLLPLSGPLTAWAPVWSTLGADGTLVESQTGAWTGTRTGGWRKVAKAGWVVGGLRILVRTGAEVRVQQVQVLWRPWTDGAVGSAENASAVFGAPALASDTVKVIELRVPAGAVPTGLWGQTSAGSVVQVSLLVQATAVPQTAPKAVSAPSPAVSSSGPTMPSVPEVKLSGKP